MCNYSEMEQKIGYAFNNKKLLEQAFTHSSYANEHKTESYERLEFLGDSILDYITALLLFNFYPDKQEGAMTRIRAGLVKESTLAEVAEKMGICEHILYSQGCQSNPISQSSAVKCDVLEAMIGAILIDSNYDLEFLTEYIRELLRPYLYADHTDYKSKLLEIFAKNFVKYRFDEVGTFDPKKPSHCINLVVNNKVVATATAASKKKAQAEACKIYYKKNFSK